MELIKKYWWMLAAAVVFMMMGKKKKARRRRTASRKSQMAMRGSAYFYTGRMRRNLIPTRGMTRRRYSGRMRRRK